MGFYTEWKGLWYWFLETAYTDKEKAKRIQRAMTRIEKRYAKTQKEGMGDGGGQWV